MQAGRCGPDDGLSREIPLSREEGIIFMLKVVKPSVTLKRLRKNAARLLS